MCERVLGLVDLLRRAIGQERAGGTRAEVGLVALNQELAYQAMGLGDLHARSLHERQDLWWPPLGS